MRRWILGLIALLLAGCAGSIGSRPASQPERTTELTAADPDVTQIQKVEVNLENYGPAPELNSEVWLNTDQPLHLADLRGQVVMLDTWTFG